MRLSRGQGADTNGCRDTGTGTADATIGSLGIGSGSARVICIGIRNGVSTTAVGGSIAVAGHAVAEVIAIATAFPIAMTATATATAFQTVVTAAPIIHTGVETCEWTAPPESGGGSLTHINFD